MNKLLRTSYTLLMFFFLCVHSAQAAENDQDYPLSMAATQQAVTGWLESRGYDYQLVHDSGGLVQVNSVSSDKPWHISLIPHSPLATRLVVIGFRNLGENSSKKLKQYLEGRLGGNTTPVDRQPEIPPAVLEKIGTVACLKAEQAGYNVQFSGVFIDSQGLILSTAHDLNKYEEITVVSTINTRFHGDIIKIDFARDLALIQIKAGKDQVVDINDGRNLLGMGEKIYSIGCPVGLRGTVNTGYINGPPRMVGKQPVWQVKMDIQHGSSGSPVFDASGTLVAIVKGRHRVSPEIGFLIPMESIIDFIGEQVVQ